MLLQYQDFNGNKHNVKAVVTTEHSASSYGQAVIVLEDGNALDAVAWVSLGYKVMRAGKREREQLSKTGLATIPIS